MARKGLYRNINNRKKSGTSRSRSNSTISDEAYADMKAGFKRRGGVRKKYAVGGLTPSANMYGNNIVPYTASAVYKESSPEYQQQLSDELRSTQLDTSYRDEAAADLAKQEKIEGYGLRVGKAGINKLTDKAVEQGFTGPDMGEDPRGLLKTGFDAAKRQRQLNIIAKGGDKAAKTLQKAKTTGDLLEGLSTYGTQTGSSALKAGTTAIKSGAGVGTVGALMAAGGDAWYNKVTNDQTLEGQADFTGQEQGASALRGAGAGVGAVSTGAALGTMLGVGAANAWNPIGWAALAAAGIGAGVTWLNRKRKAKKAGEAVDTADAKQDADVARINQMQRMDALKDKQYSGFDYGGDTKGPGFYGKMGGIRQYHAGGLNHSPSYMEDPGHFQGPPHNGSFGSIDESSGGENWWETDPTGPDPDFELNASWGSGDGWSMGMPSIGRKKTEEALTWGKEKWDSMGTGGKLLTGSLAAAPAIGAGIYAGLHPTKVKEKVSGLFARTGGLKKKKYQTTGLLGYDDAPAEEIQYDKFGLPIGQNLAMGNTTASDSARPAGYAAPVIPENQNINIIPESERNVTPYTGPYTGGTTERGEAKASIGAAELQERNRIDRERGYSIQTMADGTTFQVPMPKDHPTMEQMNRADAMNRGIAPNNAWMYQSMPGFSGNMREAAGYQYDNPLTSPAGINAIATIAATPGMAGSASAAAPLTAGVPGMVSSGAASQLIKPFQYYGRGATQAYGNMMAEGASVGSRITEGAKLGYNTVSGLKLPGVAGSLFSGLNKDSVKDIDVTQVGADAISLVPGSRVAQAATGKFNPYQNKELIKMGNDYSQGDYGNLITRGITGLLPGDQSDIGFDSVKQSLKFGRKLGLFSTKDSDTASLRSGGIRNLPGGQAIDIGNGATKYVGQTHEEGGIMADPQSEVETNEIEKDVTLADGTKNPYIYSEYLNMDGSKGYKTGGISIADKAEELARTGAPQSAFDALATMQEKAAGRTGNKIMNTTMAKYGGFQNTSNYKEGGVTKYQTRGLVMSQERQDQFENLIQFVPGVGYVGPDGTNYGFNEADVVDFVNRGGLDSYNPNQGGSYMPSEEAMFAYGLEGRQQAFRDALRGRNQNQPGPSNEATADPNFRVGQQGDLVVMPNTIPEMQTLEERLAAMEQFQANNPPPASTPPPPADEADTEAAADVQGGQGQSFSEAFADARRQGLDEFTWRGKRYGTKLANEVTEDAPVDMTGFDSRERQGFDGDYTSGNDAAADLAAANDVFVGPVIPDWAKNMGTDLTPTEQAEANKRLEESFLSNKEKRKLRRDKNKTDDTAKSGTLIKAAQFIPAALAYMDKPDYMKQPNKVGGVPRVNLENVSLDDRQAVINSDNAAVQRMISNAGMGTAGFAARMAAWNKKEGLSAAVTAEAQRLNNQINNTEAQMNAEVEARNRMIQSQNRDAAMKVDQFNTESRAATKAQRVDAVANATAGLLTQFMDQKRMDTQERIGANISGETGVLQRENFNLLTQKYNLTPGTDEYNAFEESYWKDKKKFGGMRQIPRYGYSTK